MTQAEYNAKVQEMQRMWPVDNVRIDTSRDSDGRFLTAWFQVWWDGHWHTLGTQQKPFDPASTYEWDADKEALLCAQFADALARS